MVVAKNFCSEIRLPVNLPPIPIYSHTCSEANLHPRQWKHRLSRNMDGTILPVPRLVSVVSILDIVDLLA
jgi:hypothetical protein